LGPLNFTLLQPRGQTFRLTETLFLKLLGLIYLIAFASLWLQIVGLVGENGIAPAADTLIAMHGDYGWRAYLDVPSLFWFVKSDWALKSICAFGCVAAIVMLSGYWVRSAALCAYVFYLSIVTIGQPFTAFQWDALLLESGFLAIFAGSSLLPIAYRFLLFRLMVESGLAKLFSNDLNWRNLHALRYHFLTQPLPTPLGYYFAHFPEWLLDSLTLATLFIELVVPFLLFAPSRRIRQVAVALLAALQIVIGLTGNYAFFNLLTLALCLWGLDDEYLSFLKPFSVRVHPNSYLNAPVAALLTLSVLQIFDLQPSFINPFEIVNPYGLFAVMTTSRIELIVEGSNDGLNWKPYSFRYKPGDISRGLPVVAPYQPRLDWQMWFAALGRPDQNPWVRSLVYRLLAGQTEVLELLEPPPFPKPPRQIRIEAYSYTFTPRHPRFSSPIWQRTHLGSWLASASLSGAN
jgi:hypothetical protein